VHERNRLGGQVGPSGLAHSPGPMQRTPATLDVKPDIIISIDTNDSISCKRRFHSSEMKTRYVAAGCFVAALLVIMSWGAVTIRTNDARSFVVGVEEHQASSILAASFGQVLGRIGAMPSIATSVMDRANRTHPVSPEAWLHVVETFGKFGGEHNLVTQMSYALRVNDDERADWEASLGRQITRANVINNSLPRTPEYIIGDPFPEHYKDFYLPVVATYPERMEWILYSDFTHRVPARTAAMLRTMETMKTIAAPPVDTVSGWAVSFHQAVHSSDPNRTHDGWVGATVNLDAFSIIFDANLPNTDDYFFHLVDDTDGANLLLHNSIPDGTQQADLITLASEEVWVAERLWRATMFVTNDAVELKVQDSADTMWYWFAGSVTGILLGVLTTTLLHQVRVRLVSQAEVVKAATASSMHSAMLRLMNHGRNVALHVLFLLFYWLLITSMWCAYTELRNPLTVMLATLDIVVSDDDANAAAAWLLEQAHSMQLAATTMQRALDDMLNLSTVQTGELRLHKTPFSVRSLVRDIRHYAGVSFGGVPFQCWVAPNVPERACADRLRVRELVADTVRQAHLYSQSARLGVECITLDADHSLLVFAVWGLDLTDAFDERTLQKTATTPVDEMLRSKQWKPTRVPLPNSVVPSDGVTAVNGGSSAASAVVDSTDGGRASGRSSGIHTQWAQHPGGTGVISLVLVRAVAEAMGGTMGTFHVPIEQDSASAACVTESSGRQDEAVLCVIIPVTIVLKATTPPASTPRSSPPAGSVDVVVVHSVAPTGSDEGVVVVTDGQPRQPPMSMVQADAKPVDPCCSGPCTADSKREDGSEPDTRGAGSVRGARDDNRLSTVTQDIDAQVEPAAAAAKPLCEERGKRSSMDAVASATHTGRSSTPDDGGAPAVARPTSEDIGAATPRDAANSRQLSVSSQPPTPVMAGQVPRTPTSISLTPAPEGLERTPARRERRRRRRRNEVEKLSRWPAGTHRVIVVDDEHLIRKVVGDQLKRLRVSNVMSLEDGDELEHTLDNVSQPPTCVLLDIVMRRSDGVSVLEALRRHERWSGLSVYAMTSNVESADLFKASGFDGLLGKPFSLRQLVAILSHSSKPRAARVPFLSLVGSVTEF